MVWLALRSVLHVELPCFPRDRALEANNGCWRLQRDTCRVVVHRRRIYSLVVCGRYMLVLRIDDITPVAAFGVSTKLLIIGAIRICPGPVVPTTRRVAPRSSLKVSRSSSVITSFCTAYVATAI
jgi:hypothetical protein